MYSHPDMVDMQRDLFTATRRRRKVRRMLYALAIILPVAGAFYWGLYA